MMDSRVSDAWVGFWVLACVWSRRQPFHFTDDCCGVSFNHSGALGNPCELFVALCFFRLLRRLITIGGVASRSRNGRSVPSIPAFALQGANSPCRDLWFYWFYGGCSRSGAKGASVPGSSSSICNLRSAALSIWAA